MGECERAAHVSFTEGFGLERLLSVREVKIGVIIMMLPTSYDRQTESTAISG